MKLTLPTWNQAIEILKIVFLKGQGTTLIKVLYFFCLAFITELGMVGFKEDFYQIYQGFSSEQSLEPWQKALIQLALLILDPSWWKIGGAFLVILIVAGLIYQQQKPKNESQSNNIELKKEFQRQLDEVEKLLHHFMPQTASERLDGIEKAITNSGLSIQDKNQLKARHSYLKGFVFFDLEQIKEGYLSQIRAFELEPSNLTYKERAITSFYSLKEEEKALKLVEEVLIKDDSFNPRAWAVKYLYDDSLQLNEIIKNDETFKRVYTTLKVKKSNTSYPEIAPIFQEELTKLPLPKEINYDNLNYWLLVANVVFGMVKENSPLIKSDSKNENYDKEKVRYVYNLVKIILNKVENTQIATKSGILERKVEFFIAKYLLEDDKNAIINLFALYTDYKNELHPSRILDIIMYLSQVKEYQKVIELCNLYKTDNEPFYLFIGASYASLGNREESTKHFSLHLKNLTEVDTREGIANLFFVIDRLIESKSNIYQFYIDFIKGKNFKGDIDRLLVESYALRTTPEQKEQVMQNLQALETHFDKLEKPYKDTIVACYLAVGELKKARNLLDTFVDKQKPSPDLFNYIKIVYHLNEGNTELLDILKQWREKFDFPNHDLLRMEIELLQGLRNYPEIEKVAQYGLTHFPDSPLFLYSLILSLHFQHDSKVQVLNNYLNDKLLDVAFDTTQAINIGSLCLSHEKISIGLELLYRLVKQNPYNSKIKGIYAQNFLYWCRNYKPIETVNNECFVMIENNNKQELKEVNETAIKNNSIFASLLGKSKGDIITKGKQFDNLQQITIIEIYDKYQGLAFQIMENLDSITNEMNIMSISYQGNTREELEKILIMQFGASEEKRKMLREEGFRLYYSYELTFSELSRRINDKPLDLYNHLTSGFTDGFLTVPLSYYQNNLLPINDKTEYVIDLTTLIPLSEISERFNIKHNKFIVSQCLLDYLHQELSSANLIGEEQFSLSITTTEVTPIFYPQNYKQQRVDKINRLINWVKEHCKVQFVPEKIDIVKDRELSSNIESDWFFDYLIDTIFLANKENRVLLTDDVFIFRTFPQQTKPTTLEFYLKSTQHDRYNELLDFLIEKNYVGISINKGNLIKEFEKNRIFLENKHNTFNNCVRNLPFHVHHNPDMVFEVIGFCKYLYSLSDLHIGYRKSISQLVLNEVFKEYPQFSHIEEIKKITDFAAQSFHLLGDKGLKFVNDLKMVFEIGRMKR